MLSAHPVGPSKLIQLMDVFPDVVSKLTALDVSAAPMNQQIRDILLSNDDLVRHLAAIGRNVPPNDLNPGSFGNLIAALACIIATSCDPHIGDLVQIFAIRSGVLTEHNLPPTPRLRLVAGTEYGE